MTYTLWDKTSNINNCPADDYLANHPEISISDEIVLVYGDNGKVMYVENATGLRSELGLGSEVKPEDVAKAHMDKIAEQNAIAAAQPDKQEEIETAISDIQFSLMMGGLS